MRSLYLLTMVILVIVQFGLNCGDDNGSDGGPIDVGDIKGDGPVAPPQIISITPDRGPLQGGTPVTIRGLNFEKGAVVLFGEALARDISVNDEGTVINCKTPPAEEPGAVTVVVRLPSGGVAQLVGGFTYIKDESIIEIGWCNLQWPYQLTVKKGEISQPIYGRVYAAGVTVGVGRGNGIIANVGYGPINEDPIQSNSWIWFNADYNTDVDGAVPQDLANDEYKGSLLIQQSGIFKYAFRFSGDGGSSWVYCDIDGSSNGFSLEQAGTVTVEEAQQNLVDWCILQWPPLINVESGEETELIFGRVYERGITEGVGQGPGIIAQVGYGPDGTVPQQGSWVWFDAWYNIDVDGVMPNDLANDEYMGRIVVVTPGIYDFAYRFSIDGGNSWSYCDLDGSQNGYDPQNVGTLIVRTQEAPEIDWCNLQWPPELSVTVNQPTEYIYGRVYERGITEGVGQGRGIDVELGWGDPQIDPSQASDQWNWVGALYNTDTDGNSNDEYYATITPDIEGEFAYVFRVKLSSSQNWTYCDLDGSQNGFQPQNMGKMHVMPAEVNVVDWCNLQWPPELYVEAGVISDWIYGRVYEHGITEGEGQGLGIIAQLGYGPMNTDPQISQDWIWIDAQYNVDVDGLSPGDKANDEYMANIIEDAPGLYNYAFRFSLDRIHWTYCDSNGSQDGYQIGYAGILHVTGERIDWCQLENAQDFVTTIGSPVGPIRAIVYKGGVTQGQGQGQGIIGEVCFIQEGWDPFSNPSRVVCNHGNYVGDVDGLSPGDLANDRWEGVSRRMPDIGSYRYFFRFSMDSMASWVYCDSDGSDNGFDINLTGRIIVNQ